MCVKKGTAVGDTPKDTSKTTAGANIVQLNALKISEKPSTGKISRVSQTTQDLIKKHQNVKKLRYKVWSDEAQTNVKSSLPDEPSLKLRMCLELVDMSHTIQDQQQK